MSPSLVRSLTRTTLVSLAVTVFSLAAPAASALARLGTRRSGLSAAFAVTFDTGVAWGRQVVSALHSGLAGHAYPKVVLSGFAYAAGPTGDGFLPLTIPVSEDPVVSPTRSPDGCPTAKSGSREDLFYPPADAFARTMAADEPITSTTTTGERDSLCDLYDAALAAVEKAPVLVALGSDDALVCGGPYPACTSPEEVSAFERYGFAGDDRLGAYVLPGAGHAPNSLATPAHGMRRLPSGSGTSQVRAIEMPRRATEGNPPPSEGGPR
ncbi:hypothetical protein ACFXOM_31985 [Streptomyces sp. NPDC059169]|uniref:hypothetical protein n=1 Tax=Streptomyces sp. NPDC059169 TaxID=3346754 RepID=UPI0036AD1CAD